MNNIYAGDSLKKFIFPVAANREQWQTISNSPRGKEMADFFIKNAEILLAKPVPQTSAELFMRFKRHGNRIDYEKIYFEKRQNLITLVLAECFEYKGRFIDKIIDYLWDITSEHTWCLPAHIKDGSEDPLPFLQHEQIDLIASATGLNLAFILELLEPELAAVSPNIVKLTRRELMTRIIEPLEIRPFPFNFIKKVNNWRPWCSRNCLAVVLTVLKDQPERQKKLIDFFKAAMTDFIKIYSSDGCSNEGPNYWSVSVGTLTGFYELLQEMPDDTRKYAMMGDYITHTLMSKRYFASFSDCVATTDTLPGGICYRLGERTANPRLMAMGYEYGNMESALKQRSSDIFTLISNIFWLPAEKQPELPPVSKALKYYDRLQILYLKDGKMNIAAKRGFFSNHYHMDIGQFMIFCESQPVVIDLGGTVYTLQTFSSDRYKNWILNSSGHNVPEFNGIGQLTAPPQDEKAAMLSNDEHKCVFKMDLTSAYPPEAKLKQALRTITYNYEDNSVEVFDQWELMQDGNTVRIPLYTPDTVTKRGNGWQIANMLLTADGDTQVKITKLDISDAKVNKAWGNNIHKVELITESGRQGSCKMRFTCLTK